MLCNIVQACFALGKNEYLKTKWSGIYSDHCTAGVWRHSACWFIITLSPWVFFISLSLSFV